MAFLVDGYQTVILFTAMPSVPFREKEVQPPGYDGGGGIPTTTMRNAFLHTQAPKYLLKIDDFTVTVQWDPVAYAGTNLVLNPFGLFTNLLLYNNTITITFPDLSTIFFWGWLDSFKPGTVKEGEFPTAELKIHVSNQAIVGYNNAVGGLTRRAGQTLPEKGPVYTAGADS